jgi:virulence-associated protein VapD
MTQYAVAFDLDTEVLEARYGVASWRNAYGDIQKRLQRHGISRQQGSVYFGDEHVNAVTCTIAIMDLTNTFPWFSHAVRDIRMLRIEEDNDLRPIIEQTLRQNPSATSV